MSKEIKHRVTVDTGGAEGNLGRLARAWEGLRGIIGRVTGALRGGRVDLDSMGRSATGAAGNVGGLSMAAGKLGIALAALGAVMGLVRGAARAMGEAIESAVQFQSQTFQLRMLTGSMKEARDVMLQLTEGKQAVDHIFGSTAVVDAYRKLHNYTDGALASAYAVRVLGEASMRTGKDIGSMADTVGRAWQMITAGEDLGRVAMPLMDGGLIGRDFLNDLQRMKDAGAGASEVFMALWAEIEGRGSGSVDEFNRSIDGMRKQIEDFRSIRRTAFGEFFQPLVESWTKAKLYMARDFADFARNPLRMFGVRREEVVVTSEMQQEQMMQQLREAEEKRSTEALNDWRDGRDKRDEEERIAGMSGTQLMAEADSLKGGDQLAYEQMLDRANRKLAQEREQAAAAEARLREQIEEATFNAALQHMSSGEQAAAFAQRRDAEYDLAQAAFDAGDAVKQLEHELRAMQFHGMADAAERREDAEIARRRADEESMFFQEQEYGLRRMAPEAELRERQARVERNRELLGQLPNDPEMHDLRMDVRRSIFADERRIDALQDRPDAPARDDHNRRGIHAFIEDLVNIPELSNPGVIGLDGESRGQSITERFAARLTGGQLTTSEAGRLSREAGASAIERMQVELDNERNRILRDIASRQGVTE